MADFHLTRHCAAPPAAVWDVVTDFAAYGDWMPLTRMRVDAGGPRPGWGFAGVSGLGPFGFSDSMLVTAWEPPDAEGAGRFRIVKTGRLLGGWAEISVEPDGRRARVWTGMRTSSCGRCRSSASSRRSSAAPASGSTAAPSTP